MLICRGVIISGDGSFVMGELSGMLIIKKQKKTAEYKSFTNQETMNLLNEFEVYQLGCHLLLSLLVWATQFLFAWSCWWQLYYIMALWRDVWCSSPQLFIKFLSFPSAEPTEHQAAENTLAYNGDPTMPPTIPHMSNLLDQRLSNLRPSSHNTL